MPRVAANADEYAKTRVGIFFPAHNNTPLDGNLTGQCVTLIKWFMAEMTEVSSPFAARGDARYVGDTLVAQGHAIEVPYAQRKRGDIAIYKYGVYGHINLVLSGDRVFEQNANVGGAARRVLADGTVVYASRIGSLNESWRSPVPNIYRIKTYTEQGVDDMITNSDNEYWRWAKLFNQVRDPNRTPSRQEFINAAVGQTWLKALEILSDDQEAAANVDYAKWGRTAKNDRWDQQIRMAGEKIQLLENERDTVNYPKINAATTGLGLPLDATADQIGKAISVLKEDTGNEVALKMIIEEKTRQLSEVEGNFVKLASENDQLKAQLATASGDTELLNGFGKFLNAMIVRLGLKK